LTWTINSYGLYNLDLGVQYIALEHILKTPILATDNVMFELKFLGSQVALNSTQTALMSHDVARCSVSMNTAKTVQWNQAAKDGYYRNVVVSGVTTSTYYNDVKQDWSVWKIDEDPTAPYCKYVKEFWTPNKEKYLNIYECTEIKCTIVR